MSFILLGILNSQAAGAVAGGGSYDLLETTVLGSDTASVSFTSLNSTYGSTYKHLQIRATNKIARTGTDGSVLSLKVNDEASSYRSHRLRGNGSSVSSTDLGATTEMFFGETARADTSNVFGTQVVDILDAFDTSKNTTFRTLTGVVDTEKLISLYSGLYTATTAVDSLEFLDTNGTNFLTGSRFSLYGIKAA